jgi:hypothetical protein
MSDFTVGRELKGSGAGEWSFHFDSEGSETSLPAHLNLGGNVLQLELSDNARDLLVVGRGLMAVEERVNVKSTSLRITLYVANPSAWAASQNELDSVLSWLYGRQTATRIRARRTHENPLAQNELKSTHPTLYSGGLDSTTGLLWSKARHESRAGVFVNHVPVFGKWIAEEGEPFLNAQGMPTLTLSTSGTRGMILQARGLCYLLAGLAVCDALHTDELDVTECGVTMYQPMLLPNDIVTRTTHPRLVRGVRLIAESVLGKKFRIREPFENLTKSEIISISGRQDICQVTRSCGSARFVRAKRVSPECGRCWGCLIKNVGALVAGVRYLQPAVDVLRADIGDLAGRAPGQSVTPRAVQNLQLLIELSSRILDERLPWWIEASVNSFRKADLFRHLALDTYAAAHAMLQSRERQHVSKIVSTAFEGARLSGLVSIPELEDRIARVRELTSQDVSPIWISH